MQPAAPEIEAAHARVMELGAMIEKARHEAHERCIQRARPEERQRCWELHRMEIAPLLREREAIIEKLALVASFQAPPAILIKT